MLIYEYMKNNIETEWYWGCMKGAEETLHQKSGNDCDQASLFAALLRASGFPTRYVRGTVEFFAGGRNIIIDKVKNLTGIDDPMKIAEFFQKAGIPYTPVIQGGSISNYQIEHIWIETQVPYGNYRGAIIDNSDPVWLGLDTSIKRTGYTYNSPADIFQQSTANAQLSAMRDNYLSTLQTQTPVEYLEAQLTADGYQLLDLMKTRTLNPDILKILPASMQFEQRRITNEYTAIPDDLKHKVRFTATDKDNNELFTITLDAMSLSNKQIALSYEPESVEDQGIIDSYGGMGNTPAYLVSLRPVLMVDKEMVIAGRDGLPMGQGNTLTIDLISPNGTETVTNTNITGNLTAIGITAQKAVGVFVPFTEDDDAATILSKESYRYIDRWTQAEDEFASIMHLALTRPIPTIVTVGGVIDVTYLLDMPHNYSWKGVYIDASLRATSQVLTDVTQPADARQKIFMQLSSLEGSVLENRTFEDDFQVESISTAKLIGYTHDLDVNNPQLGAAMLTIDNTNIGSIVPALSIDDDVKADITNAVAQNYTVKVPNQTMTYEDWTGIGYIKENPDTGESGYMLTGMIAGGMSVILPANWVNSALKDILSNPNAAESNDDPLSGDAIAKLSSTDRQLAIVGNSPARDIEVMVVDKTKRRVKGAAVTFTVIAGGGNFGVDTILGIPIGGPRTTFDVTTDINGIASAKLYTGKKTGDNPGYIKLASSDQCVTQVGLNVVTASVKSSSGSIILSPPFEIYGTPDIPFEVKGTLGNGISGMANNPTGSFVTMVLDKNGNPISNRSIKLKTVGIVPRDGSNPLPANPRGVEFYDKATCSIPYPLFGDCPSKAEVTVTTEYYGALTEGFFGDTVGTKYYVEASDVNSTLLAFSYEMYTTGFRSTDGYIPSGIYLRQMHIVNDKGQPIDASKAGTLLKAPLISEFILMHDDVKLQGPSPCSSGQGTCWNLTNTGKVITEKITNGAVQFASASGGGTAGTTTNIGDGKYQATYTTGPQPMVNIVEAAGTATINVPYVLYNPMLSGTIPSFGADPKGVVNPLAIKEYGEGSLAVQTGYAPCPR